MIIIPTLGAEDPIPNTLARRDSSGALKSVGFQLSDDPGTPIPGYIRYNNLQAYLYTDSWKQLTGDYALQDHNHDTGDITSGRFDSARLPSPITENLEVKPSSPQAFLIFGSGDIANINNDALEVFHNNNNRRIIFRANSGGTLQNFLQFIIETGQLVLGATDNVIINGNKVMTENGISGTFTSADNKTITVTNGKVTSIVIV